MGASLAKSMGLPDLRELKDGPVKEYLRSLGECMMTEHRRVRDGMEGTNETTSAVLTDNWRVVESGDDLILQKKISGTWTEMGKWSE